MDFFGLVDAIRDYCEDEARTTPIHFYYGANAFANIELDPHTYDHNELILIADFNAVPSFAGGVVVSCRYNGVISLGRKRDSVTTGTAPNQVTTETESDIDETPIQKYDRRLKDLSTQLGDIIGDLSCDNELDILSCNMRFDLNQFDLSADFVAAQIVFEQ
jgi:hypothetical protein